MQQNNVNVSHNKERLQSFLSLPGNSMDVSWEIATLPEKQDSGVPGPTDYVSLIAAIRLYPVPAEKDELLSKTKPLSSFQGFPTQFVRSWLPEGPKKVLIQASRGESVNGLIDVGFYVKKDRPYKQAFGLLIGDILVIYVNYVG